MRLKQLVKKNTFVNNICSFLYTNILGLNIIRGRYNNRLIFNGSYLRKSKVAVSGSGNIFVTGNYCHLTGLQLIVNGNNNRIIIENSVSACDLEMVVDGDDNEITIGESTIISGKNHWACIEGTKIEIGKDCLFSANITIRTGDSHSVVDSNGKRINQSKNVKIGEHVWIGNSVTVLKDVEILHDTVVGTGSIVTKSPGIPSCVLAGIPALVKRDNVSWKKERL